ncbi:hypothetical protein FGB62_191g09 [Gracilaria domingensis]|nr:hypothetical protein FGB62_191g09 [Gracilaria domingensis]
MGQALGTRHAVDRDGFTRDFQDLRLSLVVCECRKYGSGDDTKIKQLEEEIARQAKEIEKQREKNSKLETRLTVISLQRSEDQKLIQNYKALEVLAEYQKERALASTPQFEGEQNVKGSLKPMMKRDPSKAEDVIEIDLFEDYEETCVEENTREIGQTTQTTGKNGRRPSERKGGVEKSIHKRKRNK